MNPKPLSYHRERQKAIVSDLQELAVTSNCSEAPEEDFTWPQKPLASLEKDTAAGLDCCSKAEIKLGSRSGTARCSPEHSVRACLIWPQKTDQKSTQIHAWVEQVSLRCVSHTAFSSLGGKSIKDFIPTVCMVEVKRKAEVGFPFSCLFTSKTHNKVWSRQSCFLN